MARWSLLLGHQMKAYRSGGGKAWLGFPKIIGNRALKTFTTTHLTQAERRLYWDYIGGKSSLPKPPEVRKSPRPYSVSLYAYTGHKQIWTPLRTKEQPRLEHGCILTMISWNIDAFSPDAKARATALLDYLQKICEKVPSRTVIMLQEVCQQSLNAILEDRWVRQHFNLSDAGPPESTYINVAEGESFIMRELDWAAASYFTLMLLSKDLLVADAFRVPFATNMGRDALFAEIPCTGSVKPTKKKKKQHVIRLCTTHLESLYEGKAYRLGQLALVSAFLKDTYKDVVAGLTAGDMNAIDKSEHDYPKAADVRLRDAWEDGPDEVIPTLKPFQRDVTNGRARGNTWGYQQPSRKRDGKRMDKMLYTGSLEYIPLQYGEELTRGMRRLGVDLKTTVEAYRYEIRTASVRRGHVTQKTEERFRSLESMERLRQRFPGFAEDAIRTTTTAWVSDHYGILAKFRIIEHDGSS